MKLDTHTHTSEGSPDSIVSIRKTIQTLMEKEYDGMIVTDHNSYQGYKEISGTEFEDFVVLKGIEYDTKDAGHMLIVLPSDIDVDIFTHKGMLAKDTITIVHSIGGIIGPAHPFDYCKLGMLNNIRWLANLDIMSEFDFIEGFNSCGTLAGNNKSKLIAKTFNKPVLGGSDSHKLASVGKGYTVLPEKVKTETEFIELMTSLRYGDTEAGGEYFTGALQNKLGKIYNVGVNMFFFIGLLSGHFSAKKALAEAVSLSLI